MGFRPLPGFRRLLASRRAPFYHAVETSWIAGAPRADNASTPSRTRHLKPIAAAATPPAPRIMLCARRREDTHHAEQKRSGTTTQEGESERHETGDRRQQAVSWELA